MLDSSHGPLRRADTVSHDAGHDGDDDGMFRRVGQVIMKLKQLLDDGYYDQVIITYLFDALLDACIIRTKK
jgi:hypothetical protein